MESGNATIEEMLTRIWSEILGLDTVDPQTPFVVLGGTSIAAEQIAARVCEALNVELNGAEILRLQTMQGVSEVVIGRWEALHSEDASSTEDERGGRDEGARAKSEERK